MIKGPERIAEKVAVAQLRAYMVGLQKYRSIFAEEFGLEAGARMWPWVFGDKCPLPALSKILQRAEDGYGLAPMDYYNQLTILCRFMPEVLVFVNASLILADMPMLPEEAPLSILRGWQAG